MRFAITVFLLVCLAYMGGCAKSDVSLGNTYNLRIAATSNAAFAIREFAVFDLPYIFEDRNDHLKVFCDVAGYLGGPITEILQPAAADKDLRLTFVMTILFRAAVMRERLIEHPSDFSGIKMRTSASEMERAIVSALGANPVTMGVSEVFTALQQGTVDGEGFPIESIVPFRHYEAAKQISTVNFQGFAGVLLLNDTFYKSLSADLQAVLAEAGREVMEFAGNHFKESYDSAIARLRESDCTVLELTSEQRAPFVDECQTVIRDAEDRVGREWIRLVKETVSRNRSRSE